MYECSVLRGLKSTFWFLFVYFFYALAVSAFSNITLLRAVIVRWRQMGFLCWANRSTFTGYSDSWVHLNFGFLENTSWIMTEYLFVVKEPPVGNRNLRVHWLGRFSRDSGSVCRVLVGMSAERHMSRCLAALTSACNTDHVLLSGT
jgi:hypothetical protein